VAGTIVALTPATDMFRSICKIAVVAARPLEGGLDQDPPQIDLFWGDRDEAVFDPVESMSAGVFMHQLLTKTEYVMVEARSGYFESARHMLVAMQKLMTERYLPKIEDSGIAANTHRFNLSNHLVFLDSKIDAPESIKNHPWMNLNSLVNPETEASERMDGTRHDEDELENIDILRDWPDIPHTGMDLSQKRACKSMLRKKIAIVQGPPGTGKTFVSVAALRVMVNNWLPTDPPIIVSAQTNHALDQLLTHVLDFCPEILRLGGRCDPENKQIIERTLHELRMKASIDSQGTGKLPFDKAFGFARREYNARCDEIRAGLDSLLRIPLLTSELLYKQGIISKSQMDSLNEEGWDDDASGSGKGQSDLASCEFSF
jgi:helicase required for RNAi-mediated heterochromatin assembly 1